MIPNTILSKQNTLNLNIRVWPKKYNIISIIFPLVYFNFLFILFNKFLFYYFERDDRKTLCLFILITKIIDIQ
jgi:hypothetical protein